VKFAAELIGLAVVISYTVFAGLQWCTMSATYKEIVKQTGYAHDSAVSAQKAATTAQDTLNTTKSQFRDDQRPYMWITESQSQLQQLLQVVASGPHTGHMSFDFILQNFGKSPAIILAYDARIVIGEVEIRRMRPHAATDHYQRIAPPGDKSGITAFSERTVTPQEFRQVTTGTVPAIVFGHIEYTDALGEPKPSYISAFCIPISLPQNAANPNDACKTQSYIK